MTLWKIALLVGILCQLYREEVHVHAQLTGSFRQTNERLLQSKCCTTIQVAGAKYQSAIPKHNTLLYKVSGPKRLDDKIAIIGAGPSGIHMALLLKKKGFKNIRLLEKTGDLGGKSKTVNYRGAPQELGTVYLTRDYGEIFRLVEKYVPNDLMELATGSAWVDEVPRAITFQEYVGGFLFRLLKTNNPSVAMKVIFSDICRYNTLHMLLFGDYDHEIMPEPSAKVKQLCMISPYHSQSLIGQKNRRTKMTRILMGENILDN